MGVHRFLDWVDRLSVLPRCFPSFFVQTLVEDGVYVTDYSGAVFSLVRVGHVVDQGWQLHVPVKLEESMQVQAATTIRLYCRVVVASSSKHRFLPCPDIFVEK